MKPVLNIACFAFQIDHPAIDASKSLFPKVVSIQRKRAVIACFRQTSLYSLPRHIAINLFLRTYRDMWLNDENTGQEVLIDHLTVSRCSYYQILLVFV